MWPQDCLTRDEGLTGAIALLLAAARLFPTPPHWQFWRSDLSVWPQAVDRTRHLTGTAWGTRDARLSSMQSNARAVGVDAAAWRFEAPYISANPGTDT